ncbi:MULTISPECIES: hypothetical protein [unclassified Streptomyces]|uniref:hypothetical protein n=1 Tax=unclassified Streptomyces TaxID=2593676 RepID=UPI0013142414|nr:MULTISPECIES: hypothetical protein [unclassified Streptomyces]
MASAVATTTPSAKPARTWLFTSLQPGRDEEAGWPTKSEWDRPADTCHDRASA